MQVLRRMVHMLQGQYIAVPAVTFVILYGSHSLDANVERMVACVKLVCPD